jgi:hypothetical protein
MQTQAEMNLTGPTGQVYALAIGNELLFAATQVNFLSLGLSLILILASILANIILIVDAFSCITLGAGWKDFGMEI